MKKKLLYTLTALLALGFASCKDDDENMGPSNPAEDFDRMPMTMFRLEENTNVSNDPYGTRVITEELNTVELHGMVSTVRPVMKSPTDSCHR